MSHLTEAEKLIAHLSRKENPGYVETLTDLPFDTITKKTQEVVAENVGQILDKPQIIKCISSLGLNYAAQLRLSIADVKTQWEQALQDQENAKQEKEKIRQNQEQLEQETSDLAKELDRARKLATEQETQLMEQEITLKDALKEKEKEQDRREIMEQATSDLTGELAKARKQLMELEITLRDALKAKEKEQEIRETLQQENKELATELGDLKEEMQGVQKSKEDSTALMENTVKILDEANEKVADYDHLKEENHILYTKFQHLDQNLSHITAERETMKKDLHETKVELLSTIHKLNKANATS